MGEGVLLTLQSNAAEEGGGPDARSHAKGRGLGRNGSPVSNGWIGSLHSNRNLSPAMARATSIDTQTFFFQAAAGACPVCHGLGQKMVFDEGLVVPDPDKSLSKAQFCRGVAAASGW